MSIIVFVATAMHSQGGHGPVASILAVTSSPDTAVIAAYMAEQMGFRFDSDDYIVVERHEMEARHRYGLQHLDVVLIRRFGQRKPDDTRLGSRYLWTDEWNDDDIRMAMLDVTRTLGANEHSFLPE